MFLAQMNWTQAEKFLGPDIVGVAPLGSLEGHGPIGPLGTDYIIAEKFAELVNERMPEEVAVAPVMPFGWADTLAGLAGTVHIEFDVLVSVMRAVAKTFMKAGVNKILFLNGHGGNNFALDRVSLDVYREGGQAAVVNWWELCGDLDPAWRCGHGGAVETSMAMAMRPEWNIDKKNIFSAPEVPLGANLAHGYFHSETFKGGHVKMVRSVRDSTPSGWGGAFDPPANASAETGRAIFAAVTDWLCDFIGEFRAIAPRGGK